LVSDSTPRPWVGLVWLIRWDGIIRWGAVAALKCRVDRPHRALWSSRALATFTGHWRFAEMPRRERPLQQDRLVCARSPLTSPRMPLPPFVLVRCLRYSDGSTSASSTAHLPPSSTKYLATYGYSPNDFLGPTGLGNEDGSNGLPNDTVYITHTVLVCCPAVLSARQYSVLMDHPQGTKSHPRGKSWNIRIFNSKQQQWAPG
jgi:hypothetical protein